ncbi:uncharacterized protein LOC110807449 [Carica papaya]|uniref:uncharacterized protein LOC110807449 n=1 Tax=Carica papaya TaxID=3649 RepID=UPI000B8C85AF|nr:uncharacterized protein LOC110807449 [Carica papaya]
MEDAKESHFLLPFGLKLNAEEGEILPDPERYRRLIDRLLYLNFTRPDITYATQHLNQFMQQPRWPHLDVALHVVRYLKQYPEQGIFFPRKNDFKVQAFCDSDWASCPMTRKSIMGFCIFLGLALIS